MELWDLKRMKRILDIDDPTVAPAGVMTRFIGAQLRPEQIAAAYEASQGGPGEVLDPVVLRCVRSFPVPSLAGQTVTGPPADFGPNLLRLLNLTLPGTGWHEMDFRPDGVGWRNKRMGLIQKGHILDGHWSAPDDEATRQFMELELGGSVRNISGPSHADTLRVRGPDGQMHPATAEELERFGPASEVLDPFTPTVRVTIKSAHWTNLSGLRVGVGFYM